MDAKRSKCDFVKSEISFLGHVVSADGLKVDPKKVAAVQSWPTPSNVHEVHAFLGLGKHFRKFIKGYSGLVRPLNELLQKAVKYDWTERCAAAFEGLKQALLHAPV
jgi:hypothetical protein